MIIRQEFKKDYAVIRKINLLAFEGPGEAKLVGLLREKAEPVISLVCEDDQGDVVGHIMFTLVTLGDYDIKIMGLAPVSVLPEYQRKGYGGELIKTGLEKCKAMGIQGVVLLGHVEYYPRFGFITSTEFSITSEYDVAVENFMALELVPGAFDEVSGIIRYHPAFAEL